MGPASLRTMFTCSGILCLFLLGGCKSKTEEAAPPPVPSAEPAPSAVAPADIPVVQPTAVPAAKPVDYTADANKIKACCAALRKEAEQATGPAKASADGAAKTCDGIVDLVKKGVTRHDAALTSIRAALRGGKLPAGCQ
jgi:hypothetical protein